MVIKHVAYLLQLIFYRDLRKAAAAAAVALHVNIFLVILLSRGVLPPRCRGCRTIWSRGPISIFFSLFLQKL